MIIRGPFLAEDEQSLQFLGETARRTDRGAFWQYDYTPSPTGRTPLSLHFLAAPHPNFAVRTTSEKVVLLPEEPGIGSDAGLARIPPPVVPDGLLAHAWLTKRVEGFLLAA